MAWEIGHGLPPTAQALVLCAFAEPKMDSATLETLTIGQRDSRLLALREDTFGSRIEAFAQCAQCHEPLELAFDTKDVRDSALADGAVQTWQVTIGGRTWHFRLPTSADLAAAGSSGSVENALRTIALRCVLDVQPGELEWADEVLNPDVLEALAEEMARRDPEAEVLLDMQCPGCGHAWQEIFDVASFFWAELAAEARHLLMEVHLLARAYGWREADILAMSSHRRRWYIEAQGDAL